MRATRLIRPLTTAACIALAAAACSPQKPQAQSSTLEPAVGASSTATASPTASNAGEEIEETPSSVDADASDVAQAQKAAETTMQIWVQGKKLDQQTWSTRLIDSLAPEAQDTYGRRYGYKIPDTRITGKTKTLTASANSATFEISTDLHTYQVTVLPLGGGKWGTSAIIDTKTGERA